MLAALVVVATGCGRAGPIGRSAAASVNGHAISAGHLQDSIEAQKQFLELRAPGAEKQRADAAAQGQQVMSAEQLQQAVQDQIGQFDGQGRKTLSTASAASVLSTLVNDQISREALVVAGAKVTDQQRQAARTDVEKQITSLDLKVDDVPAVIVDQAVEQSAIRTAIEATAPPEVRNPPVTSDADYTAQLRQIYDSQKSQLTQLCLDVILAKDEAAGKEARARVEAGEPFATVAADLSQQPVEAATDGGGGCVASSAVAGVLGDAANGAKAGDLIGPGQAQDGSILLVQVDRVQVPTFEEARPQLEQANPNTSAQEATDAGLQKYVNEIFTKATRRSDVTIDPRYGSWDPTSATVIPPPDPATTTQAPSVAGSEPAGSGAPSPATSPPAAP